MLAAGVDPRYASPGVPAFLVIFFLAVATWLLIRSMVGHLRKVRYSAEQAERAEAEASAPARAARPAAAGQAAEPAAGMKRPEAERPGGGGAAG